jgi:hypothetical protein
MVNTQLTAKQLSLSRQAAVFTIVLIVGTGIYYAVIGAMVRYTQNIRAHPWQFALELALISIGVSVPYAIIFVMRGGKSARLPLDLAALVAKFIVAWVLFEVSSINHSIFAVA